MEMKHCRILFALFIGALCFLSAAAQNQPVDNQKRIPYIEVVDCINCIDLVILLPNPKYPSYVGYGPHAYNGRIAVQILIDEFGKVEKATGISGHPYFRPLLEKESLKATFKPRVVNGKPAKSSGVIIYYVTSRKMNDDIKQILPVVNGRASYLPVPDYPQNAKESCADGRVEIEILISKAGNVLSAKAKSGHPLLQKPAVAAAKRATFSPGMDTPRVQIRGVLIYNFQTPAGCPLR